MFSSIIASALIASSVVNGHTERICHSGLKPDGSITFYYSSWSAHNSVDDDVFNDFGNVGPNSVPFVATLTNDEYELLEPMSCNECASGITDEIVRWYVLDSVNILPGSYQVGTNRNEVDNDVDLCRSSGVDRLTFDISWPECDPSNRYTPEYGCAAIYDCGIAGTPNKHDAPAGLLWNIDIGNWDHAANVDASSCSTASSRGVCFERHTPHPGCMAVDDCNEGITIVVNAPPLTLWNSDIGNWDHASNVDSSSCTTASSRDICINRHTPHPRCEKVDDCNGGMTTVVDAPAGNLWNTDIGNWDYAENVDPSTCATLNCDAGKVLGDAWKNKQCTRRFWCCMEGGQAKVPCPSGEKFDNVLETCRPTAECGN